MKRLIAAFLLVVTLFPKVSRAEEFNMNYVLSDEAMTDVYSMSQNKIQEFLNAYPGVLKSHTVVQDGVEKPASQIIYEAAQKYRISPQVILTNIQKESSMITRTKFNTSGYGGTKQYFLDWILFYGICDSCDLNDPDLQDYKGFSNQIDLATKAFRRYLDSITARGYTVSGWGPNISKKIYCEESDAAHGRNLCSPTTTITITPVNAATAALYTYTPHPGGNFSFWTLWRSFGFHSHRVYPDGSLLRSQATKKIYIIQNGQKRQFANDAAFLSRYSYNRVIDVPEDSLWWYDSGKAISYANYSLLQPKGSPGIYLLVDDVKRPIHSKQAFQNAGYRREEVVKVSWSDLAEYPDGEPITTENIYPSGMLFQHKKTGAIFFVQDGVRHPIVSKDIMRSQFGKRKAQPLKTSVLEAYPSGAPIGFKDGELVTRKNGGAIYVISNGRRLPIASKEVFDAYKFKWGNVIRTSDASISVHPEGPPLTLDSQLVQSAGRR